MNYEEKEKRVKVEYVKVEFASDKEKAEAFIQGGLRYFTHGEIKGDMEHDTIPITRLDELLCGNGIYRRVETEISEHDEFIEKCVKSINSNNSDDPEYYEDWFSQLFKAGCRFTD